MNKQGGFAGAFIIILIALALITAAVIIFYKPSPRIVVPVEVVKYSEGRGCNISNDEVWCTIKSSCIDLKTSKCESVVSTDNHGCELGVTSWCPQTSNCSSVCESVDTNNYFDESIKINTTGLN
jgi:hypothetical protein